MSYPVTGKAGCVGHIGEDAVTVVPKQAVSIFRIVLS
jgi:hypothetical protein